MKLGVKSVKRNNMEWIGIKERSPKKDQKVLASGHVMHGDEVSEITLEVRACEYQTWDYTKEGGRKDSQFALLQSGCGCCDTELRDVTHWMPLPPPPKEPE